MVGNKSSLVIVLINWGGLGEKYTKREFRPQKLKYRGKKGKFLH